MCGIFGLISNQSFSIKNDLLLGLKRLEYRGYDSCGFATIEGVVKKSVGHIQRFIDSVDDMNTKIAISHTRWATTGEVKISNSHPHTYEDISVVHNGIIEDFESIKNKLIRKGYSFKSETDTEIIPIYIHDKLKSGKNIHQAIQDFINDIKGTFAILLIKKGDDKIYAIKRDSPLALGLCEDSFILGSDLYAFSNKTNKAIFFEDNQYAVISYNEYKFYNKNGEEVEDLISKFSWDVKEENKEEFPHYMIKEIEEQPEVAKRLIDSFDTIQREKLDDFISYIRNSDEIVFVACGSSYHASLIGCILLKKLGINARAVIASEVETFIQFSPTTLCIAVSQSGETMDVITPLKSASEKGAKIISIVNVPYSSIQRMSEVSLEILAGQEICVASTKAYTNQVIMMLIIANYLGYPIEIEKIPERLEETINNNREKIKKLSDKISNRKDIFILGRGISYPMAREIALKLKEIDYIHAEGMMAGELKHGTLALIEKDIPVICLIPNGDSYMKGSRDEVKSRGASVITIGNEEGDFIVPKSCDAEFAIYSCVLGHLLSYYIGVEKGLEIDKPRNLAKSVTVH